MTPPFLKRMDLDQLRRDRERSPGLDKDTLSATMAMLDAIVARGDEAVLELGARFGDVREDGKVVFTREDLAAAKERLPSEHVDLLERTAERIRCFALAQRACLKDLEVPIPGGQAGHTCIPVDAVGCYAPGGRYPLPSSVLMTAVTARAAGVGEVWVATPRPSDLMLAAASIAGADGVLGLGGVQAIGALAFGLCGAPVGGCDKIAGPGNRWVTAAKFLVSTRVGIDMLAGPSELLVLADDSADPALIAADLLAQAEHDVDAVPALITTCAALADRVENEIARQLTDLPTAATASGALGNGIAVVAANLDEAICAANLLASEHLEIMTRKPDVVAERIRHAGAVFVGERSAEVFGDYGAGPNHVLPTGSTARHRAGLSVLDFLRVRTWIRVEDARVVSGDSTALARFEGLEGHARSSEQRDEPR